MKISTKIKLDTYSCVINFIVTDNIARLVRNIYKKNDIDEEYSDDDGESEGVVIESDISNYYLLIDKRFITHNTIAHEILHVVIKMTESREIYEEESLAWISGHISGAIYKFLDKKGLKVMHE
jgi:hypothetical protein